MPILPSATSSRDTSWMPPFIEAFPSDHCAVWRTWSTLAVVLMDACGFAVRTQLTIEQGAVALAADCSKFAWQLPPGAPLLSAAELCRRPRSTPLHASAIELGMAKETSRRPRPPAWCRVDRDVPVPPGDQDR